MMKVDLHGSAHRAKKSLDTCIQDLEDILNNLDDLKSTDIYREEIVFLESALHNASNARKNILNSKSVKFKSELSEAKLLKFEKSPHTYS